MRLKNSRGVIVFILGFLTCLCITGILADILMLNMLEVEFERHVQKGMRRGEILAYLTSHSVYSYPLDDLSCPDAVTKLCKVDRIYLRSPITGLFGMQKILYYDNTQSLFHIYDMNQ